MSVIIEPFEEDLALYPTGKDDWYQVSLKLAHWFSYFNYIPLHFDFFISYIPGGGMGISDVIF
jgi:hypothetical protein